MLQDVEVRKAWARPENSLPEGALGGQPCPSGVFYQSSSAQEETWTKGVTCPQILIDAGG